MREAQPTHARNWRASRGLSRPFPVRHGPVVSANIPARGSLLSLPRVRLRVKRSRTRMMTYIAAAVVFVSLFGVQLSEAASQHGPWVGLDNGRVGDYLWEVKTKRKPQGSRNGAARRPCLLVGTTWQLGPYNFRRSRYKACAGARGHLTAVDPPLVATGVQPSIGRSVDMTAVGMIFAPAVRRVHVTLAGGRRQTIRLHRFSRRQSRVARLGRFEYAAFATRGLWCAERLVAKSRTGRTLWDSGTDEFGCGAGRSDIAFE